MMTICPTKSTERRELPLQGGHLEMAFAPEGQEGIRNQAKMFESAMATARSTSPTPENSKMFSREPLESGAEGS